ncbi:hypothetical protein [Caballeronia sp. 15711]|uniref:hypothetical protein n=1 Tax=Caballeronia sp. 15711 TaxID=3391029 RepID=UPI0039E70A02
MADLLAQIVTPFKAFIGDGAYEGEPVSHAVLNHQPNAHVVIPPHNTAVLLTADDTQRDRHIQVVAQQGHLAWQCITGYNLRNHAERAMQRYKRIFGNTVKARVAIAETRGMDQCVCTEPDDQSRYAGVRESPKSSRYRRAFLDVFFILFDNADATHQWPDSYASWPNLTCGRNTGCLYFSVRRLSYELRSNRHQSSPAHVITDDSKRTTPARRVRNL